MQDSVKMSALLGEDVANSGHDFAAKSDLHSEGLLCTEFSTTCEQDSQKLPPLVTVGLWLVLALLGWGIFALIGWGLYELLRRLG